MTFVNFVYSVPSYGRVCKGLLKKTQSPSRSPEEELHAGGELWRHPGLIPLVRRQRLRDRLRQLRLVRIAVAEGRTHRRLVKRLELRLIREVPGRIVLRHEPELRVIAYGVEEVLV